MTKPAEKQPRSRARLDLSALDGSLAALNAGADSAPGQTEVGCAATIALDLIDEDVNQPRKNFNAETLRELAESIQEVGLQSPVIVQPKPDGRYLLLQGGRRFRACKLLGMTEINALFTEKKDAYAQMVENLQRDDLTPMEIAHFVGGELSRGIKQTDIARRLGKSKVWVSKHAKLAQAPDLVMRAAADGKLPSVDGIYDVVTHLENVPADRARIESWLGAAESLTRIEIAQFLGRLKTAKTEEQGAEASAASSDEDEVINAELSTRGHAERPSGDGDVGSGEKGPSVRKHASNLDERTASTGADAGRERERVAGSPGTHTLQNRSSSEVERGTNVPREKAVSGPRARKARLMATFGVRKVEIDLTRLPADAKFFVRFVDGTGEAVAAGDALSDLALSDT
jgi:ParB family chromosome partitioning protein